MKKHEFIFEDKCYVLLENTEQGRPRAKYDPIMQARFDFIFHPERGMGLIEQVCYRPYVKSIVTESPWMIACYDREDVYVWDKEYKDWMHPDCQTYGASVDHILHTVLGIDCLLPRIALNGVAGIKEIKKELLLK